MTNKLKSFLSRLIMLHRTMLILQVVFAAVAFVIVYKKLMPVVSETLDQTFQLLTIVLAAAGFLIGKNIFWKKIAVIRSMPANLKERSATYLSACILHWAMIEGPALFAIVCFLLTGNYAFLALAIALILVFLMLAPSKLKAAFHLQVSEEELDGL